jgi:hypothetical protein
MQQSGILDKIQHNMQPGNITRSGFLGTDARHLGDILIDDDAHVKRLGVSHQAIADRMQVLREKGAQGLGNEITIPPHYRIRVDGVRGKLPCPFGDVGLFPKTNTTITNTETGETITYTDLSTHMVGAHGFYEGHGGCFRLDPEKLVSTLDVRPETE